MRYSFLWLCLVLGASACSKSPETYNQKTVTENQINPEQELPEFFKKPQAIATPDGVVSSDDLLNLDPSELEFGGAAFDAQVDANSRKPILYGEGAAGITFKTTYEESRKTLTPRNPPDINGSAYYEEQMQIRWRTTGDRVPLAFTLLPGYRGVVQTPAPHKPLRMNQDFSEMFEENTLRGAEEMARYYYRVFENKNESFDCIAVGYCGISWGNNAQSEFVIIFPGMQMLLSKDRFVLFVVMVVKQTPQGIMGQVPLDLVGGKFVSPDGPVIAIDQSFSTVESILQINTETSTTTTSFGRNYSGIFLGYHRTEYGREALLPLPDNKLTTISVSREYRQPILIGGKGIIVRESANDVELTLASGLEVQEQNQAEFREVPLRLNLGLQRHNVLKFAERLSEFLDVELKKANPQSVVTTRLSGLSQNKVIKTYTVLSLVFDPKERTGFFVLAVADEEEGNLAQVYISRLGDQFDAFDSRILKDLEAPLTTPVVSTPLISIFGTPVFDEKGSLVMVDQKQTQFTEISGFRIGETIEVTDWDLGRDEATIRAPEAGLSARGSYVDRSVLYVAFNTEKVRPQDQAFVTLGNMGVTLGLKMVGSTPALRTYKVVSISSTLKFGEVQDLCGGALKVKFYAPAREVLDAVKAIPSCVFKDVYDSGGNGRLTSIYFPNERLRLGFGDLELTAATIYRSVDEVQ